MGEMGLDTVGDGASEALGNPRSAMESLGDPKSGQERPGEVMRSQERTKCQNVVIILAQFHKNGRRNLLSDVCTDLHFCVDGRWQT